MKTKAVFLCRDGGSVDRVYGANAEIFPKLTSELDFPGEIVNMGNIDKYKGFTNECRYVFSTWGMLDLGVDDIKKYLGKCEVIFYGAGSVQYFARGYLNSGIRLSSSWVANGIPVAEFALSQILLANKGYFKIAGKIKKPEDWWGPARAVSSNYTGNYNSKIGIIGAGTIGKRIITYLRALGVKAEIYVCDPNFTEGAAAAMNVKKAALEEIFKTCGVISNHSANLPSTVGMINKTHFALMRDYATFINTGRGAQVVEADMTDALKNNPTLTALLDVTDPEPPKGGSELYNLENVIMTPHIAGVTGNELLYLSDFMYGEYRLYDSEKKLNYEVTLDMLEYMA